MYESPYTAWFIHQDKAREAVALTQEQRLLEDVGAAVLLTNHEGLLHRISRWMSSRNHPTKATAEVNRVPAH